MKNKEDATQELQHKAAIFLEENHISGDTMVEMTHGIDNVPIGAVYLYDLLVSFSGIQNEKRLIGLSDTFGKEIREGDVIECGNYKMYGGKFTVTFDPVLLQWVGKIPQVHPVPICDMVNPKIINPAINTEEELLRKLSNLRETGTPGFEDYVIWYNELVAVTRRELTERGFQNAEFKINNAEARKCFDSDMTPFETFREHFTLNAIE